MTASTNITCTTTGIDRTAQLARFGLHDGQFGRNLISHNAGWYNADGVKIGFGDLAHDDVSRIIAALKDDEMFVTLGESDSFWEYATNDFGDGDIMNPGRRYIAEHCRFIVTNNGCSIASDYSRTYEVIEVDGITFEVIDRARARAHLGV